MTDILTCPYGHHHRSEQQWRRCARRYDRMICRAPRVARTIGRIHGRDAAEWWSADTIGGQTLGTAVVARCVLLAFGHNDPEVWDMLPAPDLSGQWADGFTVDQLTRSCGLDDEPTPPADGDDLYNHPWDDWMGALDDSIAAYEDAFCRAAERVITRACRFVVDRAELPVEMAS